MTRASIWIQHKYVWCVKSANNRAIQDMSWIKLKIYLVLLCFRVHLVVLGYLLNRLYQEDLGIRLVRQYPSLLVVLVILWVQLDHRDLVLLGHLSLQYIQVLHILLFLLLLLVVQGLLFLLCLLCYLLFFRF